MAALAASAEASPQAAEVDERYEFRLGDEQVTLAVCDGTVTVIETPPHGTSDVVVCTDHETLAAIGSGRASLSEALETGRMKVEGDAEAMARWAALFGH